MKKQALESQLSKTAGVNVEITFARKNMITICWEGENENAFDKLNQFFCGKLYGYEFDEECDYSVCCLDIK